MQETVTDSCNYQDFFYCCYQQYILEMKLHEIQSNFCDSLNYLRVKNVEDILYPELWQP